MPSPRRARSDATSDVSASPVVDLERYVPAFFTWIANKLSRGASQHYLSAFDTGIEVWRCLVLLAAEGRISAQHVSKVIGMDKASVSRCFKSMQTRGLIEFSLDESDGRLRLASLTAKGRRLHDQILGVALERERAFLDVLTGPEREMLIALLQRLHENHDSVEVATSQYIATHHPQRSSKQRSAGSKRPEITE